MGRRGPKQEVHLVEEGEPEGAAPHVSPPDAAFTDAARRRRRKATTLAVGVLAVLVLVGVVGQGIVTARERDRLAAVAALPNVLAPLDGPPEVLWTSDETMPRGWFVTSAGHLVGPVEHPDGGVVARAVDLATGRTAWEVDLLTADDERELPAGTVPVWRGASDCSTDADAPTTADVVLCTGENSVWIDEAGTIRMVPATVTHLVLLDALEGTVLADLTDAAAAAPSARSSTVLGELVLLAGRTPDGAQVRAVRRDGTVVWRTTVPTAAATGAEDTFDELSLTTVGSHAALVTRDAVHLLDATGATVRRTPRGADSWFAGATEDAVVLMTGSTFRSPDVESPGSTSSTFVRADGEVTYPGQWVRPSVDDGTAPFADLTWDADGLHAWDREGAALWTAASRRTVEAVVLDGLVHLTDGTRLRTLDARTGAEVWQLTALRPDTPLLTDGSVLVVTAGPTLGEEGGTRLVALARRDGSELWRAPLPEQIDTLQAVGGTLLGTWWGLDGTTDLEVTTALG